MFERKIEDLLKSDYFVVTKGSTNYKPRMDFLKSIPTHMDFDGQAIAENLSRIIVVLFGVVGLIWGYIIQQFSQTVYILGAGLVLATILTVPPWPLYRLKPLNWQKPRPDPSEGADSKSNKKKK